jgi:C-terminal peptidase prc
MAKAFTSGLVASLLLVAVAVVPARAAEAKGQTYVLVVGIDSYADKQIQPRTHAEADAKAFYDLFTNKDYLGAEPANARLLLGGKDDKRKAELATHDNLLKAFKWIAKANREDKVYIGLFMQGAPKGESACYLATDSTFKDRAKDAVAAADIAQELDKTKCQHFVVFLDVNFAGFNVGKDKAPPINLQNLYTEFKGKDEEGAAKPGRIIFLANAGLRNSLEGEKHGLFAEIALKGLKGAADVEGKEADGLITCEELVEYLDKEIPPLVRKLGKTKEDQEQLHHVLGGRDCRYALTTNPAVTAKVKERVEKFVKLANEEKLPPDVVEQGVSLLTRMPKLEAHRTLRKEYQNLADGKITVADFTKERKKLLEDMKYGRGDALAFAAKIIQASQQLREDYVKELNQGDLVGWAIEGLYRGIGEKMPKDVKERIAKAKEMKEEELTKLLADVRERLGNREDLDKHKDIDIALQMMTRRLDPYTTYIDPETLERFRQDTEANFTGIGIQIRKDTASDMLMVVTPIKDSPAYKAGVKAGDIITKIKREMDSKGKPIDPPEITSTKSMRTDDAVKKILGQKNTKVKLIVERKGEDKPLEFEITRGLVEVETVLGTHRRDDDNWDYWIDHKNKIAYVRVTTFANNTSRDLAVVLNNLQKKGINGFVLDLRFNPGGLLTSAVQISDMFIDDGVIVSIRPRVGKERSFSGDHEGSLLNFPMVCLVNGGSASGSEIVSACLQDHHRAIVMGERSYGKGSVQNIQNFEGGKLKLTTASFWRPSGKNLNKSSTGGKESDEWGVTPDKGFLLKLEPKEREELADAQHESEIIRSGASVSQEKTKFKDRQLDMALEYLRKQIKLAEKSKPPAKEAASSR